MNQITDSKMWSLSPLLLGPSASMEETPSATTAHIALNSCGKLTKNAHIMVVSSPGPSTILELGMLSTD